MTLQECGTAPDRQSPAAGWPGRPLDDHALQALFYEARTHNVWQDRPVGDEQLHRIYDLMKWGPTSANCCPIRIQFLRTRAARERLLPHLASGNVQKAMTAPVTAVIGYDLEFHRHLSRLFAHDPGIRAVFADAGRRADTEVTAFRNGSLQAGYFILAARAVGLDCGPMSGFDMAGVDREFWSGTSVRTNFLCNLGHGDAGKLYPRLPRLDFDDACRIL